MTQEKRTALIQQFSEQVALNFINMALEKAMQFDTLVSEIAVKTAQAGLISAQTSTEGARQSNLAKDDSVKTAQAGLISAQASIEGARQGLISAQIGGFSTDASWKASKVAADIEIATIMAGG